MQWANGYTMYAFDITPDKGVTVDCRQANLAKTLHLDLTFDSALKNTINLLIFAVTDSMIE